MRKKNQKTAAAAESTFVVNTLTARRLKEKTKGEEAGGSFDSSALSLYSLCLLSVTMLAHSLLHSQSIENNSTVCSEDVVLSFVHALIH